VPLTKIQADVLRLIASHRNPESYVAGATPLNRNSPRYSGDIDVFHDREESVQAAALQDAETLTSAGYRIEWLRRTPLVHTADAAKDRAVTRLDWVVDSDYRFFPTMPDETFGYLLHPVDLAINKVMAAAGRREVRDVVDLLTIHEAILPLGAAIWAAVDKAPGFTPEGLIAEVRRNLNFPLADWRSLVSTEPLDPRVITPKVRVALDEAEAFVARMPTEKAGLLFLSGDRVVQPDPDRLDEYQTHAGARRGHWPSSPEIAAAMLERYSQLRKP
jgi:hypothetical protein